MVATGECREVVCSAGRRLERSLRERRPSSYLRIAAGIPRYGVDIRERDLPQETEQERALSFSRDATLARKLWNASGPAARCAANLPASRSREHCPRPEARFRLDGKDVGEITSAASLPLASGDRRVALGYIRREAATPGKVVDAGGSEATRGEPAVH